ncbi:neurogenic protein mastermind isoform X2 [Chrysoperla carnea]|uniref:neurogenic protein mastermind isoform X2 n=1 Tax=Chrysoperla carnea TaxID=189513 RepID=UPI001D066B4F|nr:neurogenic protein mastermind isoform X2 [Chrysoperla carnea]
MPPQGLSPMSSADVLPHKRQVVVDRLRRRMESYRRRQTDCQPRFDQTFGGLCEQNMQDTLALKQRFLETKAKRQNKTKQDKQNKLVQQVVQHQQQQNDTTNAALQSSVHVQQKFLKRGNDDMDNVGGNDGMEPPVKLQCTAQHNQAHSGHQNTEGLTKFSVEIVQQLEFTTSAANSQPQQISTNVTVKALTNTSVKSDISSPKTSNPSTPASTAGPPSASSNLSRPNIGCVDIGTLVECKQEPDNDFADLDQCAAALEKDAQANGGNSFPGFSDLIGDDTSDEIITSDAFKDLISEISDLNPEFMKEFDFEEKCDVSALNNLPPPTNQSGGQLHPNEMKMEDTKDLNLQANNGLLDVVKSSHSPLLQNAYSPPVGYENQNMNKNRLPYSNMDFPKTELSPAAQTLKQMAEQHQHKNQMGLAFNTGGAPRAPNARSPYSDFSQFNGNEFLGSPNSNQANVAAALHNKNNFPQSDLIKQELNIFNNQPPKGSNLPTGPGLYKQQYSPYNSPSANHGSPGYMPRGPGGGPPGGGPQGGGPPPRPPSGANSNTQSNSTTLQINQAQQLHISQPGHGIQVSAGQHMHLSGDLKGNVSIAAQQGMYFSQQQQQQNQQHNQQHNQQTAPPSQQSSTNNHPHNIPVNPNGPQSGQQQPGNMHSNNNPQQQNPQQQRQQKNPPGGPGQQSGPGGLGGPGGPGPQQSGGPQQHQQSHIITQQTQQMQQQGDTYTVSQSQTINFTQQTLRQRAAAQQAAAAASNKGYPPNARNQGPVQMPDNMMPTQQHMMSGHGGMHNNMMGGCRPPPPDYKSSAALMQGAPSGYPPQANSNPNIMRRLTQQTMPPSGPMMRPQNMPYNMMGGPGGQQMRHAAAQGYSMAANQMRMGGGADGSGPNDWRSMAMMSQQQNIGYGNNQMRGMMGNPANMPQMHSMQGGGMGGNMHGLQMSQGSMPGPNHMMGYHGQGMGGGGMQMNPGMMNPQMMSHQQNMARSASNQQISITNINMSQQQSFTMSNTNIHQQQPQQQSNNSQQMATTNQSSNNSSSSSVVNATNNQNNNLSNFPQSAPDFIDFLDNLPAGDTNNFSAQDLLNSLDSDPGFNLQDIL